MKDIVKENNRRKALLAHDYDPESGRGCTGERRLVKVAGRGFYTYPEVKADPSFSPGMPLAAFERLRARYDFEFWAWRCAMIHHKLSGQDVKFVLNRPQRRLLATMEEQRRAGQPIRVILLKARQWGGSTLTQLYMAWIQITQCRNWNSIICAHVKDAAAHIRGIYSKLLENYPEDMWEEDEPARFNSFERSLNTRIIGGRGAKVTVGSCENQEASRGSDLAMAHLSEVAFWRSTANREPEDMVQAVVGGIARARNTLVVMESTARGVGSFFHREWLRAEEGKSGYKPVFVPWYEIEAYTEELRVSEREFFSSLSDYELALWEKGLTLEQIAWYRGKRQDLCHDRIMKCEYPTTPVEAFANSGFSVFDTADVEALRSGCKDPLTDDNERRTWELPQPGARYAVAVDVGGRSQGSDYSVIVVVKNCAKPEVVAQWRGHMDYDLLANLAAGFAREYNNALLIIESNTPEHLSAMNGEPSVLLDVLGSSYPNFYRRRTPDGRESKPGFHMNRETKAAVVANMQRLVRDRGYVERDIGALEELLTYELQPDGGWCARSGCHDDMLVARSIALYVISRSAPPVSRRLINTIRGTHNNSPGFFVR